MTTLRSVVLGCGSYLPARIVSNDELARSVETTDEWIVQRTGIRERHIAAGGELTSDLALHAARVALANARIEANSIDLIVLATSTPDQTSSRVCRQHRPPRHHARSRLRSAGGLLWICLCPAGG